LPDNFGCTVGNLLDGNYPEII